MIFTGGEDSIIRCWDTRSGQLAITVPNAHSSRIRGVALLNSRQGALESGEIPQFIASASSDGTVRIWDTRMVQEANDPMSPEPIFETSTKSRLTCLVACGSMRSKSSSLSYLLLPPFCPCLAFIQLVHFFISRQLQISSKLSSCVSVATML